MAYVSNILGDFELDYETNCDYIIFLKVLLPQ